MKSMTWYRLKKFIPNRWHETLLNWIYHFRVLFYLGNNVYCPCCNTSFNSFNKYGICPKCGSGSRQRLLKLYLVNKTNFFVDQLKVLHFAAEHCFFENFKNLKNLQYISADIDSPRAMEKIDITQIGYPDNHFDVIITSHVLEHITEDQKAILELYRVLTPGGWSINQVPIDYSLEETFEDLNIKSDKERQQYYGHHDHKRKYGRDYKKRLEDAGYFVTEDSYASLYSTEEAKRLGIDQNEKIYYCKKL